MLNHFYANFYKNKQTIIRSFQIKSYALNNLNDKKVNQAIIVKDVESNKNLNDIMHKLEITIKFANTSVIMTKIYRVKIYHNIFQSYDSVILRKYDKHLFDLILEC